MQKSDLQEFVSRFGQSAASKVPNLQFFHSTINDAFLSIVSDGRIIPTQCKYFKGDEISYFFFGRPAYKSKIVYNPSYWQLPTVFIFDRIPLSKSRVYPFDTGAFFQERYREILGIENLSMFELNLTDLESYISVFFGSKKAYAQGVSKSKYEIDQIMGNTRSLLSGPALNKLQNFQFNEAIDDRSRIIEIQIFEPIELTKQCPKAIILCEEWLRDQKFESKLRAFTENIESYPLYPLNSSAYYSAIYKLAEKYG